MKHNARIKTTQFQAGCERLAGNLVLARGTSDRPSLLILHGAGEASKERSEPLALELAQTYGISSFAFDFSGHGQSTGELNQSSLEKRVQEALAALNSIRFYEPISICAFSMGGYVALKLLGHVPIRAFLLFYPAIYTEAAFRIPFGNTLFTEIIRERRSWEKSDVLKPLEEFSGNFLLVIGENDRIIPKGVIDLLWSRLSSATKKRLIVVPDAPHLLLPKLFQSQALRGDVLSTIAHFVSSSEAKKSPINKKASC